MASPQIFDKYGIGAIVRNSERLIDPFQKILQGKAGGSMFDKSMWFKQSPLTEEGTPLPFYDGPVKPFSNAFVWKFFRASI